MEEEGNSTLLRKLSLLTGTSDAALCLFLSILSAYPVALIHRYTLYGKPPGVQHLYFTAVGLIIGYLNFGIEIFHTTITILIVYIILKVIGGTLHSVLITLSFTMLYLIVGYIKTETDSYDIVWTMPYCILVLRLTGLAFDIYDGSFPEEKLSSGSKKVALREVPGLLEVTAFAYFPTSFLVGPQFPMKRYQDFVSGKLIPHTEENALPECLLPGVKTFLLGVFFLAVHLIGSGYFSTDFLISSGFSELSFISRLFFLGIWGHLTLQKYIAIWLLCEGSCTLIGLSYNGQNKEGKTLWNGCSNINVLLFEGAQNFNKDYIQAFNVNTNHWVLQYIYKRLKFLGNKYYSQIGVLLFLSVWHGLHSGYYMTFAMEFLVVAMEKDVESILNKNPSIVERLSQPGLRELKWIVMKIYTLLFMGPCVAPLALLSFDKWWFVYTKTYFFAQLFWLSWFLYRPLVIPFLLSPRKPKDRAE